MVWLSPSVGEVSEQEGQHVSQMSPEEHLLPFESLCRCAYQQKEIT